MEEEQQNLTYHTRELVHGYGCLPFFLLVSLPIIGLLFLVPVKMPERLVPQGEGLIYYNDNTGVELSARAFSPLPLLQPHMSDPDFDEENRMPLKRELKPLPAPPARLFPSGPDSVVLDAADLLALPPADGKEVQP